MDVSALLSSHHEKKQKVHRSNFLKQLVCVRFLARQGIALLKHREDGVSLEGNLLQLPVMLEKKDPYLNLLLEKKDLFVSRKNQ